MREIWIIGVGMTRFGKLPEYGVRELAEEAVFAAQSSQEESVLPKKDALATKSSRKKPVGAGRQLRDKKGRKRNER